MATIREHDSQAKGEFQGTSQYKLDRTGKIYEHQVDNLAFNFPHKKLKPAASVLDLVTASSASSPNPTFFLGHVESCSSSWMEFYQPMRRTLDQTGNACDRQFSHMLIVKLIYTYTQEHTCQNLLCLNQGDGISTDAYILTLQSILQLWAWLEDKRSKRRSRGGDLLTNIHGVSKCVLCLRKTVGLELLM
ncbi:LOW QUALITY PROTEIN: hypothetical protein YC2023_100959 [Brassica napus]